MHVASDSVGLALACHCRFCTFDLGQNKSHEVKGGRTHLAYDEAMDGRGSEEL